MKKSGSDIPAAELEVLGALWRLGRGTVRDVLDDLAGRDRRLAYTTVLTLLSRLEKRGHVRKSRDGQAHVFRPHISEERVTADRMGSLAKSLGHGQTMPLLLKLVEAQHLSTEDIRQLRELLTRLEDEAQGRGDGSKGVVQ
jgi:predicted transcriptional regulator